MRIESRECLGQRRVLMGDDLYGVEHRKGIGNGHLSKKRQQWRFGHWSQGWKLLLEGVVCDFLEQSWPLSGIG